jgi:hypothetical protein
MWGHACAFLSFPVHKFEPGRLSCISDALELHRGLPAPGGKLEDHPQPLVAHQRREVLMG